MKLKSKKAENLGTVCTQVNLKDKKAGITLVSLVVTIIILLILAGVTLALISGSDGILGRASHALDENKIAMAKEQVELALSDFQTEFFEGKYVERTNNGTKKEYISEKLQAGVETTNFYAQASAEGNVTVYEGKDSSGTEVVRGAIQEDASIKWDDVVSGSLGGNGGSGEGGNGNFAEVTELKEALATLQEEVAALKTEKSKSQGMIDTSRILKELTIGESYTTTEDCIFVGSINAGSGSWYVLVIDGNGIAPVGGNGFGNCGLDFPSVYLKKGSTISIERYRELF